MSEEITTRELWVDFEIRFIPSARRSIAMQRRRRHK